MPDGKVFIKREGNLGTIKIAGMGTFQSAVAFKTAYTELLAAGVNEFVIDLSECEHLDSTFLGMILGLGLKMRQLGFAQVQVAKANEMVRKLFLGTGLDQIFDMVRAV
jgi:anti-anti-sigma factor